MPVALCLEEHDKALRLEATKHTLHAPVPRRPTHGLSPTGFDRKSYRRRNEVERTINRLKNFRTVATRYGKQAYVFHGTVSTAAIRL